MAWCGLPVTAQQLGNLSFRNLSVKDGLTSNVVQCLYQDSRGFIWIGTVNGLNRYDGVNFKQYTQGINKQKSLPSNSINNLCEDKSGNIWIGTLYGLARLNPTTATFTHYLPGSNCFVYVDKQNIVWVSNDSRLSRFDPGKNNFIHYPVNLGQSLGITRNYNIRTPFEDKQGRLWLPTSYGVQLFNRANNSLQQYHFPEQQKALGQNTVITIRQDGQGNIYATTWGAGLLRFNEATNQFENITLATYNKSILVNIVFDLLVDGQEAWLATAAGLVKVSLQALQPAKPVTAYHLYIHNRNDDRSLPGNELKCLLKDRAGSIWVGSEGLSCYNPLLQQFVSLRNLTDEGKALGATAFAPAFTSTTGSYLFGTYDLYGVEQPSGTLRRYTQDQYMRNPDFGSVVWDIAKGKNYYWLATTNGLLQLSPDKRLVKKYPGRTGAVNMLPGERLWKVYEDSKGLVWTASVRHGVALLNPTTNSIRSFFTKQEEPNSLFNKYTSAFMEDRQHNIWFGTNNLLYCWQRSNEQFVVYPITLSGWQELPIIQPFMQSADGQIWLASALGLLRFNPIAQQVQPVLIGAELSNVQCVTVDLQGYVWLGSSAGLIRYDTATKSLKKYTTQNGLESNDNINTLYTMPSGDILMGGDGYITSFNPQLLRSNTYVPPVVITRVQVNGKDTSITARNTFRLPYHSSIGFEFAALNFSNAEKNQYQYMLEGIDHSWIPATQRSVLYGELPPGDYVFKVKGSNDDGVWNEIPASFAFTIPTPWYRSAWFIIGIALLAAALLYAAYRYRLRQALQMERLRTRIATDLHDDIGATLSSISMYSETVKNQLKGQNPQLENVLNKMGESSRDMVTSMSDMVWAINPGNDEGDKLVKRMESYATDICAIRNITLHFVADTQISTSVLPLEHRKNMYLIFKEAVNNAVKYAYANNIWVQLGMNGKRITLLVKDDGKGYDPETVRPGNGLKNFSLRAKEIGGQLTITAAVEQGVAVQLECYV